MKLVLFCKRLDYGALKIAAMGTSQIRDDPGFAVLVISGAQRSFDIEAIANELARTPSCGSRMSVLFDWSMVEGSTAAFPAIADLRSRYQTYGSIH